MRLLLSSIVLLALVGAARAQELTVPIHAINDSGVGEQLGSVSFANSHLGGILITPDLQGLQPGLHGFHLHENPSCEPGMENGVMKAGLAAGGHFDPQGTESHAGPFGRGHLGDLPALYVNEDGTANLPLLAPRLTLPLLRGRAVVVHAGGDNYADKPEPLGGGGARVACGVISVN